jgi:hypothetical protein
MKNDFLILIYFFALSILSSCSGSDVYQGNWKATDNDGNKFEINFQPKKFSIKDQNGKTEEYDYTQNSVKIKNSTKSYGIQLSDGRVYTILFPISNETTKGVITLENNQPLYTIGRTAYIEYNDLYKLIK